MQAQTSTMLELLKAKDENRDVSWEDKFVEAFAHSKVDIENEEPITGPDGWPYLLVKSSETAAESVPKVLEWLSDKGVGLALNAKEGSAPDYVFTYGMIWNYMQRGQFFLSLQQVEELGEVVIEEGQEVMVGEPSEDYFPKYARSVFKQFLKDQEIEAAKLLVMSPDEKHFDLCFSLESLGNPPEEEHEGILEAFSWFFPMHYSLMLISEEELPEFFDL